MSLGGHVRELAYLHSRDVTYAVFCQGLLPRVTPTELHGLEHSLVFGGILRAGAAGGPVAEPLNSSYPLLDITVYGRQEFWEDSPDGWPRSFGTRGEQFRSNGRPTAQWARLAAGYSDDLHAG